MARGPANDTAAETSRQRTRGERERMQLVLEGRANVKRAEMKTETGKVSEDQMTQEFASYIDEFGIYPKTKGFKQGNEVRCELKENDFSYSIKINLELLQEKNLGAMAVAWARKDASGKHA